MLDNEWMDRINNRYEVADWNQLAPYLWGAKVTIREFEPDFSEEDIQWLAAQHITA